MSVAALRNEADEAVQVKSDVLGELTVPAGRVVVFPEGLLGFPEARSFVLVPAQPEGAYWLQSVEHSSLIFLVVDPFAYFDDYAVDLPNGDVKALAVESEADIAILAIVTLAADRETPCTANLQGPLALNVPLGTGRQVVLANVEAGVRRPIRFGDW